MAHWSGIKHSTTEKPRSLRSFDRLQLTRIGFHIGEIICVVPRCADDAVILADNKKASTAPSGYSG